MKNLFANNEADLWVTGLHRPAKVRTSVNRGFWEIGLIGPGTLNDPELPGAVREVLHAIKNLQSSATMSAPGAPLLVYTPLRET